MPTSEARILANRQNAAKSTGPRTEAGKARSRVNAYKHGLTGQGIVMPEEDAAEVDRLAESFRVELGAPGQVGAHLAWRMALQSVRMHRCFDQETAALAVRVRTAIDEFEPPEGTDEATARAMRAEVGGMALFDPSPEATLARRYEAAAERDFNKALLELRRLKAEVEADGPNASAAAAAEASREAMGSYLRLEQMLTTMEAKYPEPPKVSFPPLKNPALPTDFLPTRAGVDVPITIGRKR